MARGPKPQKQVAMIATRGFRLRGESVRAGARIEVPELSEEDGVPPVRWWQYHRKAAIDAKEAREFTGELIAEGAIADPNASADG